jgi:hypothetical protein
MTDKSRAAFEKWYMSGDLNIKSIHSFDPTYYTSPTTRIAWGAWQASREMELEQAAQSITEPIGHDSHIAMSEAAMTIRNLI